MTKGLRAIRGYKGGGGRGYKDFGVHGNGFGQGLQTVLSFFSSSEVVSGGSTLWYLGNRWNAVVRGGTCV